MNETNKIHIELIEMLVFENLYPLKFHTVLRKDSKNQKKNR